MKKFVAIFAALLFSLLAAGAPRSAAAACKPVVIEYYYMKNCRITKTKRWNERRRYWDVTSKRSCSEK